MSCGDPYITYTGDTVCINPSTWYTPTTADQPSPYTYTFTTSGVSTDSLEYRTKVRLCFGESKKCEGCRKALSCMSGVLPKEVALVRKTGEEEVTYYLPGCTEDDFPCLEETK